MSPQWHKQYDRLMLLLLVLTLFLFTMYLFRGCGLIGCGGVQVGGGDNDPADCPQACNALMWYACEEGQGSPGLDGQYGTPDDTSCVQVCEDLLQGKVALHPKCMANIRGCQDVGKCIQDNR
jgi:hypothetical protein